MTRRDLMTICFITGLVLVMTAPGRRGNLERRLADLLDRQDISALLVRFARCLDTKDFAGYADCYAPEGLLQLPRGGHEGRAGMAEYVERDLGGYGATHHVSANHEIEIDDDTARTRSSLHATHVRSTEDDFWSVGGCTTRHCAGHPRVGGSPGHDQPGLEIRHPPGVTDPD